MLNGSLFSVGVRCARVVVYVLGWAVGWGVIVGLTGVMFVVLIARGVVTGGVA